MTCQQAAVNQQREKPAARTKLTEAEKQKANQALINRMGVDPEHGWQAHYEVLPGKENVVAELKKLAKDADAIYLATDLIGKGKQSLGTYAK